MSEVLATPQPQDDALSPPTFDVLPLSSETRATLAKIGYKNPTPVQRAVFEPASRGKDLVVQARTGTGKTAAFGLPIVEHLVRRSQAAVQTLCLCPTRELALQVAGEIERLGEGRQIKPVAIYGGAPMGRQIEALRSGAQVVVGTPGRVLDHIRRGTLPTETIRSLVLDEADEMLAMGFERELTAILNALPRDRQTLLFSATVPPDIERMARERLRQPEFITLSSDAVGALSISHFVYFILEDKLGALLRILDTENPESAIVFCNTKAETEVVAAGLSKNGYDADWLNGDLPQNEREEVVTRIRNGSLRFLVATDVAARGIDISHLTHVINYDFPENTENYVHRTGRTGRAGRTGTAISLVHPQDIGNLYFLRLAYKIKPFERSLPTASELRTRSELDLIHSLGDAFAGREITPETLLLARRLLTHDQAETLVAHLLHNHFGDRLQAELGAASSRRARNPLPPPPVQVVADAPAPRHEPREHPQDRDRGPGRGRDRERSRFGGRGDRGGRDDRGGRNDRGDRRDGRSFDRRRDETSRPPPAAEEPALPVVTVEASPEVVSQEPPAIALPEPVVTPEPPPAVEAAVEPGSPRETPAPFEEKRPRYDGRRGREPRAPQAPREQVPAPSEQAPAPQGQVSSGSVVSDLPRERRRRGRDRAPAQEQEFEFRYTVSDAETPAPAVYEPAQRSVRAESTPRAEPRRAEAPVATEAPARPTMERPSDLAHWHPPEEENDDLPIWGAGQQAEASPAAAEEPGDDQDYALVFVDVGRREGVRPSDLQRVLRDRAGIGRRETGRIRVRDRHSLIAVRRDLLDRAIDGMAGAEIAGRVVRAEQAREREPEND
jgi:ATP-dependent RNA helicase DeaD